MSVTISQQTVVIATPMMSFCQSAIPSGAKNCM
jgi:hypothetical protein